jgi:hypothetical protein
MNAVTAGKLKASQNQTKIITFTAHSNASTSPIERHKYRKSRHHVDNVHEAGSGSNDAHVDAASKTR